MAQVRPEWVEHQCKRWLRHDAHRWLRPDCRRFLSPDADPEVFLRLFERKANFNPNQPRVPKGNPDGG